MWRAGPSLSANAVAQKPAGSEMPPLSVRGAAVLWATSAC
jgi:hypothetical protein